MGRKQVFDNIDYQQVVHHMDEEHQNLLHHWTSYMSTENRVSGNHLPDCQPQGKLEDMENGKCIPNHAEHRKQRQSYIHLISRICSENITCLKPLMSSLPKHIPHVYTEQMSHPTETVRFYDFLIDHSENKNLTSFSISQNETQPAVFATMTFSVGICRVDLQVAYIHYIYSTFDGR